MCTLEGFAADCDPVLREFSADRIYKVTAYKKVLWHGYRKRDQIRVIAADRFQHGILRNSGTEIDAVLAIIFKNISYHTCTHLVEFCTRAGTEKRAVPAFAGEQKRVHLRYCHLCNRSTVMFCIDSDLGCAPEFPDTTHALSQDLDVNIIYRNTGFRKLLNEV